MKNKLLIVLSVVLITALCTFGFSSCGNQPRELEYGDYQYTVENEQVTITKYNGNATDITIPESIDGMPVVCIGNGAFLRCSSIKSLTVPDSVVVIHGLAFNQCTALEQVTLGKGLREIDYSPFAYCNKIAYNVYENGCYLGNDENPYLALVCAKHDGIESLTIHPDTRIICGSALKGCSWLSELTIPQGVIYIGSFTFQSCKSLKSVYIPQSVETIESRPFDGCNSIQDIAVSEQNPNYKSVDGSLFSRDGSCLIKYAAGREVSSYRVPDGTVVITAEAFEYATNLTEVVLPDSVEEIGHMTFIHCENLQRIHLGNSLKTIDGQAFGFCKSLTEVSIPDSVQEMSYSIFSYCDNLERVVIGSGVTRIEEGAFRDCKALNEVVFRDPSGWQVKTMYALWWNKIDVSDPAQNAQALTGEYIDHYWSKK